MYGKVQLFAFLAGDEITDKDKTADKPLIEIQWLDIYENYLPKKK